MREKRFAEHEARRILGQPIRSLIEFSGVAQGTTGRVVEVDEIEPGGFDAVIEWDLSGRSKPLRDWFTKSEYEQFLVEVRASELVDDSWRIGSQLWPMKRIRTLIEFAHNDQRARAISLLSGSHDVTLAACPDASLLLESRDIGYHARALWVLEFHKEELSNDRSWRMWRQRATQTNNQGESYESEEEKRHNETDSGGEDTNRASP